MSLQALIALARTPLDYNDPEVQKRFAEARKRMDAYDKELEERVRQRYVTQEQLQRPVNWGAIYG